MQKLPVSFPGLSFCRVCPPGFSRSCRLPAPSAPMRSYIRRDAPDERESSSDRRESTLPAGGRASAPAAIIAHPAASDCRVLPLFREWRQRSPSLQAQAAAEGSGDFLQIPHLLLPFPARTPLPCRCLLPVFPGGGLLRCLPERCRSPKSPPDREGGAGSFVLCRPG